jgi:adenylosuccinate synthase
MPATGIVDTHWGDSGKGKLVDLLAKFVKLVGRSEGGNNAGHRVTLGKEVYNFHILPSGMLHRRVLNVVGNGTVINPEVLAGEIRSLERRGFTIKGPSEYGYGNLLVSELAHVIIPWHIELDGIQEKSRGSKKIGTTGRGIGPAYSDKAGRSEAIRMEDFIDPGIFEEKVYKIYSLKNLLLKAYGKRLPFSRKKILKDAEKWRRVLKKYVGDSVSTVNEYLKDGKEILLEGAQGHLLDIDHGTFPYVTSSHPTIGGACTGLGISPKYVKRIIGVCKAYTTRVGEGAFPTEFLEGNIIGERIRELGGEYGTTTGRPRRVGWLDAVMLKHAHMVNGFDGLAIMKLDVLTELDYAKICYAYEIDGKEVTSFTPNERKLRQVKPVYETFDDWQKMTKADWRRCIRDKKVPRPVEKYLDRVHYHSGVPIKVISVSPERNGTIFLEKIF